MNQQQDQLQKQRQEQRSAPPLARTRWTCCKAALLAAGVGAAVAACGDRPAEPPPGAPPRLMTRVDHLYTAQLDLRARPVVAPPGAM